jgi:uncharacterized Rossmann fold enzyme
MDRQGCYCLLQARNGEKVPALSQGEPRPLHSMIDPRREAQKLVSTLGDDTGFIVFLGLGGGFAVEEALKNTSVRVLVIEFNKDDIDLLFSLKDYSSLLKNERFHLLIDPSTEEIKNFIATAYRPALFGGIKTIPLRTRIEADFSKFDDAAKALSAAIENVSGDYSVQAHFGKRWFSNIIRNLKAAENQAENLHAFDTVNEAAIVAAGPSLDMQITAVKECKSRSAFIICCDTALPVLLRRGIEPDAVVSIDCQHISYYHFMGCNMRENKSRIPLFLDIASPPLLCGFSNSTVFFSSAHPLALYISQYWRPLPLLDTSGGNVTYACLSLAENLGAKRITLFGADFSYVKSSSYARGTYIFPFFEKKQNRFSPAEALFSAFLYRSPFLPRDVEDRKKNFYETTQLRFYREKLEEKAAAMDAQILSAPGMGAPINLPQKMARNTEGGASAFLKKRSVFQGQHGGLDSEAFLKQYSADIAGLPPGADNYLSALNEKDALVFTTLLPLAAAFKHREAKLKTRDLIDTIKEFCVKEIEKVLAGLYS